MKKKFKQETIPFHPAYGYVTPEQINQLKKMGMCPDRDQLLKQIQKQQENQGRIEQ